MTWKSIQQQFVPDITAGLNYRGGRGHSFDSVTQAVFHTVLNCINEQPSTKTDQPFSQSQSVQSALDLVSDWPDLDESSGMLR